MRFTQNFVFVLLVSVFLSACSGSTTTPESNTANTNAANRQTTVATPAVSPNANAPAPIVSPTIVSPTIVASADAAAPCNVYLAYHMALVKNDEAALRKTLTQASIRQLEAEAKAEGEKTIVGNLNAYSKPSPQQPACGGTVQGDVAMLQIRETSGAVTKRRAVRENNEWKLDMLSIDLK